jgi:hypothetical protein
VGSTPGDGHPFDDALLNDALAPAATQPATRRALRRSTVLVALFAASAVLLTTLGVGLWWRQHSLSSLSTTGVRTTATVDSIESHTVARERHTIGSIDVTYGAEGQPRHTKFDVSINVTQYHTGDKVAVAYDRSQPDRVDLIDEPAASQGFVPWEVPAAFAVLAAVMAAIAIRHLRSYRRILRRHEWLAVPAVLKGVSRRLPGRGTTVVELGESTSPERIVASAVGIRALPPTVEPVAWVAGWGERRFVLAPPGGSPLLLMHRLGELGVDAEPDRPTSAASGDGAGDASRPVEDPRPRHAP